MRNSTMQHVTKAKHYMSILHLTLPYHGYTELRNASPQRYYTSRSQTIAIRNIARLYPGETRRDCAIPSHSLTTADNASPLHYRNYDIRYINPINGKGKCIIRILPRPLQSSRKRCMRLTLL